MVFEKQGVKLQREGRAFAAINKPKNNQPR